MTTDAIQLAPALVYRTAAQLTDNLTRLTIDWWWAQPARLFDETAPWNLGFYVSRRLFDAVARPVRLVEEERGYRVEAEIPPIRPEDLDVRVGDGMLRISAEPGGAAGQACAGRQLSASNHFERTIVLPVNADADRVTAAIHDGRLTVIMPKHARGEHKVAVTQA